MLNNRITYSIVIPAYNEEENIPELCRRLHNVMENIGERYEIIFVNDGSTDSSLEKLIESKKLYSHIKIINLSRNFGHQAAIISGLDHADGKAVITLDADLQDPPEVIPRLVEKWKEGYDVVYGIRKERQGENLFRVATAFFFYRLMKIIANINIPVDVGDFRLMSRRVVDNLKKFKEKNLYIRGLSSWIGFCQTGIPYVRKKRFAGRNKYSLRDLIKFTFDGIISFTFFPLHLISYFGFIVSFFCAFYFLRVIYLKIFTDLIVPGWTSLMVAIVFLGGIQLISLGIIGQYISRIGDNTKNRPRYIIKDVIG